MVVSIQNVTFDCADALTVARFWSAATGRPMDPDASSEFASIGLTDPVGTRPRWLFAQVPEPKVAKNRLHLDVEAPNREIEVERLLTLGAKRLADVEEWGHRWTVMADPEGNEFCVATVPDAGGTPSL